jgi:4-amino-4-deoxy-L-arabinose transferase-like glycosyltransferase
VTTLAGTPAPADTAPPRRVSGAVLGIAAAAVVGLVVRVAYVVGVDPVVRQPSDGDWYHRVANALADGHGYVHPYLPGDVPTADFPPALPFLLAPASWLGFDSVRAHQLVLCVVGTATVVAIGLLGRRLGGARVGVLAAALAAVYPPLWQLDGSVMAETPYVLVVVLLLVATLSAAESPSIRRFAVVGALCGLIVLTRSDGAVLAPLLVGPVAVAVWRTPSLGPKRALAGIGAAVGAAVLVLTPWTVRNLVTMDALVLGGNNSGGALAGSYCDRTFSGAGIGLWDLTCIAEANDRDPIERDETDRAAYLRSEAVEYARDHVGDLPKVVAIRVARVWGLYPTDAQLRYEGSESRSYDVNVVAHRCFLVMAPLAVAGAVVARRRRVRVWPLLVGAVGVGATAAVTYGNQRFRAVVEPSVVVLAALALVAAAEALGGRRRRDGQPGGGAVVDGDVVVEPGGNPTWTAESLHGGGGGTSPEITAGSTSQLSAG